MGAPPGPLFQMRYYQVMTARQKKAEPEKSEGSERSRFAKKLVNVPKRELDEKAREWTSREDRPPVRKGSKVRRSRT